MTRVCVLGNSHIGALKQGVRDHPKLLAEGAHSYDFFGSIRASIQNVEFDGTRMVPARKDVRESFKTTSGGRSEADLGGYDLIVMALRNTPFWIKPYLGDKKIVPLSRAVVQAVHDVFLEDWCVNFARRVCDAAPQVPVKFIGRPFNLEGDHLARFIAPQFEGERAAEVRAVKAELFQRVDSVVAQTVVRDNLEFVRPPAELLDAEGVFTGAEYGVGAVKFRKAMSDEQPAQDTQHANGLYGATMMRFLMS